MAVKEDMFQGLRGFVTDGASSTLFIERNVFPEFPDLKGGMEGSEEECLNRSPYVRVSDISPNVFVSWWKVVQDFQSTSGAV